MKFEKKKRWVSLWDRGAQGTEYHQDGFLWHLYGFYDVTSCYLCNSIQIFPNADLMDMRKFYIFERNTQPILNLFFYLKRRNLSLDNRKRITTIYVTVWKLFTYTRLEIVINFSQMPIWWICENFIFWTEYSTDS